MVVETKRLMAVSTPEERDVVNLKRLAVRLERTLSKSEGTLPPEDRLRFVQNVGEIRVLRSKLDQEHPLLVSSADFESVRRKIDALQNVAADMVQGEATQQALSTADIRHRVQAELLDLSETEQRRRRRQKLDSEARATEKYKKKEQRKSVDWSSKNEGARRKELFGEEAYEMRQRSRTSNVDNDVDDDDEASMQNVLQHHRMLQSDMTEQLVAMAQTLKRNTLAFGDLLKADEQTLRDATNAIESNLSKLTGANIRLGAYRLRARGTTWITLGIVAFVAIMFVIVFLIVRIFPKVK